MTHHPAPHLIKSLSIFLLLFTSLFYLTDEHSTARAASAGTPCTFTVYSGVSKTVVTRTGGHKISFKNNTKTPGNPNGTPIWLGVIGDDYKSDLTEGGWGNKYGFPGPNGNEANKWANSWKIEPGPPLEWCAPVIFGSARIWPRTGCELDKDGVFTCKTGDCKKTTADADKGNDICRVSGDRTATGSFTEFSYNVPVLNKETKTLTMNNKVYYDLSFVDGYDFPIEIKPLNRKATDAACVRVGCGADPTAPDNKLPETCLSDPNGAFVNGTCLAPYNVFNNLPANKYLPESNAISAKCADPNVGVNGCALDFGVHPEYSYCPDTFDIYSPYTKQNVTQKSGGCSPIGKYWDIGKNITVDPKKPVSFWNQMPCDPETGEGALFAPYEFDFNDLTNKNPQGYRALMTKYPKDSPTSLPIDKPVWTIEKDATGIKPQIIIKADEFHRYESTPEEGAIKTDITKDLDTLDQKQISVYVDKKYYGDLPKDVKPLNPNDRVVNIDKDNKQITITIKENSDFIGRDYPVTVNIANKKFECTPWPAVTEYTNYVKELHKQCPGVYTWQYDDLVGLASCEGDAMEDFEITFHPLPDKALNSGDYVTFAPDNKLYVNLTTKDNKSISVIGQELATIAMNDTDSISFQAQNCGAEQSKAVKCTVQYNKATQLFANITDAANKDACDALFASTTKARLDIKSPADACLAGNWDRKTMTITPIPAFNFDLMAGTVPFTFIKTAAPKSWTIPTGTAADIAVNLTATCNDSIPTKITCNASYSVANAVFTLASETEAKIKTYCGTMFLDKDFPGNLKLLPPIAVCPAPAWDGKTINFFPLPTVYAELLVDGKSIFISDKKPDPLLSYGMPAGNSIPFILKVGSSASTSKEICNATLDVANKKYDLTKTAAVCKDWCTTTKFSPDAFTGELRINDSPPVSCSARPPDPALPKYDLFNALTALQIAFGLHPYTEDHKSLDVAPLGDDGKAKGDGDVGVPDVVMIMRYLVGLHDL